MYSLLCPHCPLLVKLLLCLVHIIPVFSILLLEHFLCFWWVLHWNIDYRHSCIIICCIGYNNRYSCIYCRLQCVWVRPPAHFLHSWHPPIWLFVVVVTLVTLLWKYLIVALSSMFDMFSDWLKFQDVYFKAPTLDYLPLVGGQRRWWLMACRSVLRRKGQFMPLCRFFCETCKIWSNDSVLWMPLYTMHIFRVKKILSCSHWRVQYWSCYRWLQ